MTDLEITVTVKVNEGLLKESPTWAAFLAGADAAEAVRELVMDRSKKV